MRKLFSILTVLTLCCLPVLSADLSYHRDINGDGEDDVTVTLDTGTSQGTCSIDAIHAVCEDGSIEVDYNFANKLCTRYGSDPSDCTADILFTPIVDDFTVVDCPDPQGELKPKYVVGTGYEQEANETCTPEVPGQMCQVLANACADTTGMCIAITNEGNSMENIRMREHVARANCNNGCQSPTGNACCCSLSDPNCKKTSDCK